MNNYDIKCKVIEEELRDVWPEWHVAGRLGSGAFGDVFQIYRDNFGIRVDSALKVIQMSSTDSTVILPMNKDDQERAKDDIPDPLRSEIQIMEALRGAPNIVTIEDFYFRREGLTCSLFVRMELLTSLQEILQGPPGQHSLSSIPEIIKLGRDICKALIYCENKEIIHRDIKPENLFVDEFGEYKVGDFGASKRMDTVHVARTMTGIGTLSYMAPEVFRGQSYNNTVDIYALGLVLYRLLNNGRMPFLPADGSYTMRDIDSANYKRLHGTPLPALTGKTVGGEPVSDWLDTAVRKACAVDPADRYQTAKEFYNALNNGKAEEDRRGEEERERQTKEKQAREEERERQAKEKQAREEERERQTEKKDQRREEERDRQKEERSKEDNTSLNRRRFPPFIAFIAVAALMIILTVRIIGPPEPGPIDPPGGGGTASTTGNTGEKPGSGSGEGNTGEETGSGSEEGNTGEETGSGSGEGNTGEKPGSGSGEGHTGSGPSSNTAAYADIIRKYDNNYGPLTFDEDDGIYLGVFLAKLIDFDQDGTDELLIGYSEPIEDISTVPAPKLDVWTMENGLPVQAYKGARVMHGDIGSHCAYCNLNGTYYLCTGTAGYALNLALLSLENGSFTQALTLQADRAESNYTINGAVIDQDEWNELYQEIEVNTEEHTYSGSIDNTGYESEEALRKAVAEDYKVFDM